VAVYHIYKANCYNSSRVMLQTEWDFESILVHQVVPKKSSYGDSGFHEVNLGFLNLLRIVFCLRSQSATFVFHAQSSLPFLLFVRLLSFFLDINGLRIVYDIHDYHERKKESGLYRMLRYYWFRYLIIRCLESLVLNDKRVRVITVSNGLSKKVSESYGCGRPKVVMSAHQPPFSKQKDESFKNRTCHAVYFGISEHAPPVSLVKELAKQGISFHIYGRGMSEGFYDLDDELLPSIRYFGEYDPSDLSFLLKYRYLVLYKPEVESVNYRVALPNKMFQGMGAGLSFIVSQNFEEMIHLLNDVPGSLGVLKDIDDISRLVGELEKFDILEYGDLIQRFLFRLTCDARSEYLSLTKNEWA